MPRDFSVCSIFLPDYDLLGDGETSTLGPYNIGTAGDSSEAELVGPCRENSPVECRHPVTLQVEHVQRNACGTSRRES